MPQTIKPHGSYVNTEGKIVTLSNWTMSIKGENDFEYKVSVDASDNEINYQFYRLKLQKVGDFSDDEILLILTIGYAIAIKFCKDGIITKSAIKTYFRKFGKQDKSKDYLACKTLFLNPENVISPEISRKASYMVLERKKSIPKMIGKSLKKVNSLTNISRIKF